MKIRFLGTGTSTGNPEIGCDCEVCLSSDPRDKRFRSSALIEYNGKHILIDCGPDFRSQMLQTFKKNPFLHLDGVLITHEHYDHVGGLDDLRCFTRHNYSVDIYTDIFAATKIQERLPYIFNSDEWYPGIPNLAMHVITSQPFNMSEIEIIPVNLLHGNKPIFGYRINDFAYLTDLKTIPTPELDKLKNLSVLVINALREKPHATHASISESLEYIKIIKPQKAYLTHVCHNFGLHESVQKQLPQNVFIAYDGLEIYI